MAVTTIPILDRVAVLGSPAEGSRSSSGRWVSGELTELTIWGMLKDIDYETRASISGFHQIADVWFLTRYRADMFNAHLADWYLRIDGVKYVIQRAYELPEYGRRRFMMIEGRIST